MFPIYDPENIRKNLVLSFQRFSVDVKRLHWPEMGYYYLPIIICQSIFLL